MKTFDITVGKGRNPMVLDAAEVIGSCLLIQGARKSGKSYAARVIVEQTIPKFQTIILDSEGEFSTLREKCNLLIAGKDGDVPCEVRSAKLLARRLAETGVSAVVDFSDLKPDDRRIFVRDFLAVFNTLPKKLQDRPRLFVIDEAHVYCPESGKGQAASTNEVVLLLSAGRKRGFGTILLTQRLSKLKNDAASECGTILIGKTSPIDAARAQDLLGLERKDRDTLKRLKPGTFYGDGNALPVEEPVRFEVRKATTTHPEPGVRYKMKTPPPKRAIKKILAEFAELPPDKETEDAENLAAANKRIRELERDLRKSSSAKPGKTAKPAPAPVDLSRYVTRRDYNALLKAAGRREAALEKELADLTKKTRQIAHTLEDNLAAPRRELPPLPATPDSPAQPAARPSVRTSPRTAPSRPSTGAVRKGTYSNGGSGFDRMLHALAQHEELAKRKVALLAGISAKTGTFRNYVSKGKVEGYWTVSGNTLKITEAGIEAAGDFEPLPQGSDLVDYWKGHKSVPTKAGEALDFICSMGEDGATKEQVAEHLGIQKNTGTFRNYISRIRSLGLISGKGTEADPFIGAEGMRA